VEIAVRHPCETVDTQQPEDMTEQLKTAAEQTAPRAKLLDLSLTQLIAGSLAAATAAALGSRLGVVGTITGAAVGSVISAVTASVYVTSMRRARGVLRWHKVSTRQNGAPASAIQPSAHQLPPTEFLTATQANALEGPPLRSSAHERPLRRQILGSAAAVFALATAFLLGLQLASGADLTGTSIGTRPPAAQGDSPRRDVADPDPSPTDLPVATSTAPASTDPDDPDTGPPTELPETPGPTVTSPPAGPSPSDSPTTPTEPSDPGQPIPSVSPTTGTN
jgi:hypothetical protein